MDIVYIFRPDEQETGLFQQSGIQYKATVKGILYFYGLLLLDIGFIIGRSVRVIRHAFPGFFSHTSNFVIGSILVAVISFIWLLQGAALNG